MSQCGESVEWSISNVIIATLVQILKCLKLFVECFQKCVFSMNWKLTDCARWLGNKKINVKEFQWDMLKYFAKSTLCLDKTTPTYSCLQAPADKKGSYEICSQWWCFPVLTSLQFNHNAHNLNLWWGEYIRSYEVKPIIGFNNVKDSATNSFELQDEMMIRNLLIKIYILNQSSSNYQRKIFVAQIFRI